MRDLFESLGGFSTYPLRGRIGREQIRVRGFDGLQFVHQRIVGSVADLRRIENVIQVLVTAQFGTQMLGTLRRRGLWVASFAHGENYRRPEGKAVQGSMVGRE